jgi:hypothetical protein
MIDHRERDIFQEMPASLVLPCVEAWLSLWNMIAAASPEEMACRLAGPVARFAACPE